MASMKKVLSQLIICEKSKTGESSSCVGEVPSSLVKKIANIEHLRHLAVKKESSWASNDSYKKNF